MRNIVRVRLPLVAVALSQAFSAIAHARETDDQLTPTVRVTATKAHGFVPRTVEAGSFRGADVMDVPSTVNVVTREVLELQGAAGLYDAVRNTVPKSMQNSAVQRTR